MPATEVKTAYAAGKLAIGCGFEPDWLRERSDFSGPITTILSEEKPK